MWRWSYVGISKKRFLGVFSTYVEVILTIVCIWRNQISILHVCGGDPTCPILLKACWTVFSTYVEVILSRPFSSFIFMRILHVCGGDPIGAVAVVSNSKYSPRMWRWSQDVLFDAFHRIVFSTYVEVIPKFQKVHWWLTCILHVCGGDP